MGLSLKKIKKKISLKNVSPVAMVASNIKKPAEKVISTGKIGIKDVVEVSPIGLGTSVVKSGVSNIKDVVMDKPILSEPEIQNVSEVSSNEKIDNIKENINSISAISKPKPKSKTLVYVGIGVGVLLFGYLGYKFIKK